MHTHTQPTSHSDFSLLLALLVPCCAGLIPEHHSVAAGGSESFTLLKPALIF